MSDGNSLLLKLSLPCQRKVACLRRHLVQVLERSRRKTEKCYFHAEQSSDKERRIRVMRRAREKRGGTWKKRTCSNY